MADEAATTGSSTLSLPTFVQFDINSDANSLGPRWSKWLKRFTNFLVALDVKSEERKRALLLHYAGEDVADIFDTLTIADSTYDSAIQALNNYFVPKQNTEYETFYFRQIKQQTGETLDQFNTRLRKAATTCGFANMEREIKSQIVIGCLSSKLRKHALESPTLDLTGLLAYGRANELAERHTREIESVEKGNVNAIQKSRAQEQRRTKTSATNKAGKKCSFCGYDWHIEGLNKCPAKGQNCLTCGKRNHFAKVCKNAGKRETEGQKDHTHDRVGTKRVNRLEVKEATQDKEETKYVFTNQNNISDEKNQGEITLTVLGKPIKFLIDSGATVDIMNKEDFEKIGQKPDLTHTASNTYAFGSNTPITLLGTFKTRLHFKKQSCDTTIHVTNVKGPTLIGRKTALKLEVIRFLHAINEHTDTLQHMLASKDIFQGVGKHKQTMINLHIDKNVKPVIQKHRRIPFHMRQRVEKEIAELIDNDIVEEVPDSEPTPWVSPIIAIPKKANPEEVRICIDMRVANKAIQRERHPTPTMDDILYDLNGATVFSKLDLRKGYHQFELAPESRPITTFSTHTGLYRYKRLNFGISSAAEIFQHEITKLLQGIQGTINISDDILVYGTNQQEHDKALEIVLRRIQQVGLTLNKEKCIISKSHLNFMGHIFSEKGITVDPNRIQAIAQIATPTTQTELRSLLGMVNFCGRFIPQLAIMAQPLRMLTKKDTPWKWTVEHQQAINQIKKQLAKATNMAYFNRNYNTEVWVDASPKGLGAILVQKDSNGSTQVLAYASHTLSPTETRYSQIEREALALTWAIEHFRLYLFGSSFIAVTDHQPLVSLFNNPQSQLSTRMERWRLKLQPYTFKVEYRPGKNNPADYLSRYSEADKLGNLKLESRAEEYANFILQHTTPKAIRIEEVEHETLKDQTLQIVLRNIHKEIWTDTNQQNINQAQLEALKKVKLELSTNKKRSVLLRGARLVLPTSLQQRAIDIAHQGHLGIVKTKALVREKIWFNGIDKMVETTIKHCLACQAVTNTCDKPALMITELPEKPWQKVNIDHKGPLPTGEYILVIVDQYSRFPVTEIVKSTSAEANLPKIDHIFATFGIPDEVCTDNGAPFNSLEFKKLGQELGFKHRKITPVHPQANGEVERFNRTLNKVLRIVDFNNSKWKRELNHQLRAYRASPHATTGSSPAELLFGHQLQTQLPEVRKSMLPTNREQVALRDNKNKQKMKDYHDQRYTKDREELEIGDTIIIKQKQTSKTMTPFNQTPRKVTEIKGSMITSEHEGKELTRNVSQTKLLAKKKEELDTQTQNGNKDDAQEEDKSPNIHQGMVKMQSPKRQTITDIEGTNTPSKSDSLQNQNDQMHNQAIRCRPTRINRKPPQRLIEEMD